MFAKLLKKFTTLIPVILRVPNLISLVKILLSQAVTVLALRWNCVLLKIFHVTYPWMTAIKYQYLFKAVKIHFKTIQEQALPQ